jgi:hypothetical protein
MTTFRKYQFEIYADFRAIYDIEASPNTCVELGHINPDNSKAYCVDILWETEEPVQWKRFHVWPQPIGIHCFAGWEEQYMNDYNNNKP